MMWTKAGTSIAACIATLALALSACGSSSGDGGTSSGQPPASGGGPASSEGGNSGENVTISYLTHWGPDQIKQLEAVAATFHDQNPSITVKFQTVPFANLLSTVQTQGASASGATMAGVYNLWLPGLIKDGIAAKAPADVADDVRQHWSDALVKANSADGNVYGIPSEVDLYALNYNKKLFDAAGISDPPKTWDELVDDAAKLTDKANGVQGFGVITNWDSGVDHPFLSLAASNGATLLNSDMTKAALTDPAMIETATLYETMLKAGSIVPSMSSANANTTGPYLNNFANGKTAMIIMANWWESALKDAMGDNFDNVATAPIPVGPSGDTSSSISYSWLTMVNAHASDAEKAAAWKFLEYLNGPKSGKDGSSAMGDILHDQGILPSRQSDLDAHQDQLSNPFIKTYVDEIPDATAFPSVLGGQEASDALQTNLENLIFGKASAEDAMKAANKAVDAALDNAAH